MQRVASHGIRAHGSFVLGLGQHTADNFEQVLDSVMETELYDVQITRLTPLPGTPLYSSTSTTARCG